MAWPTGRCFGWLARYPPYIRCVWLPMTPKERRITRLVVWTTVIEFVVFVFANYWNEPGG